MKIKNIRYRAATLGAAILLVTFASTQLRADTGICGGVFVTSPFTDVPSSNIFFCSIAEAYFSGLTNGTTPTTYGPSTNVPREQMAAFITRTLDQSLRRGSDRAALGIWWRDDSRFYSVPAAPKGIKSDGKDLWVADGSGGTVLRVRASDGKLLETWRLASGADQVLVAGGYVYVTDGAVFPGKIHRIDPSQPAGDVTTITSTLPGLPFGITFDGRRLWVTNNTGSVSVVLSSGIIAFTVSAGLVSPSGILFDGVYIWVTDFGDDTLKKLDLSGNVLQTVPVGADPSFPVFDGTNIWVPNTGSNTVSVVRAATGAVLATLGGDALNRPLQAAFDGQRVLVTNLDGTRPSMWKATDLSPIEILDGPAGGQVFVCSDGVNFWMTRFSQGQLWRY